VNLLEIVNISPDLSGESSKIYSLRGRLVGRPCFQEWNLKSMEGGKRSSESQTTFGERGAPRPVKKGYDYRELGGSSRLRGGRITDQGSEKPAANGKTVDGLQVGTLTRRVIRISCFLRGGMCFNLITCAEIVTKDT